LKLLAGVAVQCELVSALNSGCLVWRRPLPRGTGSTGSQQWPPQERCQPGLAFLDRQIVAIQEQQVEGIEDGPGL
jgi:hypothetical protein